MYRSVNINDDVYYSEIQIYTRSKRKKLRRIYFCLGIFMLLFFGVATYDIAYWGNECNLHDSVISFQNMTEKRNTNTSSLETNANNNTQIPKLSHQLHCFIFLYGVTFYFYLLLGCLAAYSIWNYYSSVEINDETCSKCILTTISTLTWQILMIIIWIVFILAVVARMALFVVTILEYKVCHEYCNSTNVLITLISFAMEFLINAILVILGLCFVYMCMC
jgi:hypothetical protein